MEKLMEKPVGVNEETKGPGWKIAQTRNSRRSNVTKFIFSKGVTYSMRKKSLDLNILSLAQEISWRGKTYRPLTTHASPLLFILPRFSILPDFCFCDITINPTNCEI